MEEKDTKNIQEVLEDVLTKLIEINQRQAVIEAQQKLIMNRFADLPKVKASDYAPITPPQMNKPAPKNIPVTGTIVNTATKKGVTEVQVTVYDGNGEPVKATKTNNAGLWRLFLNPGKYQAHYHKTGHTDRNIVFVVKSTDRRVEVVD